MHASSDQITLRRYLDPLRRFTRLMVVGTVLGAGLGVVAHVVSGTSWTSTVSVLVAPISGDPVDGFGTGAVEVDMATEAEVATSQQVAERANDLLAGQPPAKDPRDLLRQVETSVRGTRIIEMSFTASEPEVAQRGAAAFADAFLAYRTELVTSRVDVASGRLTDRVAQLQIELTDVSTRRAEVPVAERDDAAYAALVINEQTLLDELSANQSRLADLRSVMTDDAVVLDTASLPRNPSSLGMLTLVVGGAAVGFVLSAGLALILDAARRRSEDENEREDGAETMPATPMAVMADAASPAAGVPEPDAAEVTEPAPATWREPAAASWDEPATYDDDGAPSWNGPSSMPREAAEATADAAPLPFDTVTPPANEPFAVESATLDTNDASVSAQAVAPDPVDATERHEQVWGGPEADAAEPWPPAATTDDAAATNDVPAADDAWGVPLSASDEDTWTGIVEATTRAAEYDDAGAVSTPWEADGVADDTPSSTPTTDRWQPEANSTTDDTPWGTPTTDRWQPEANSTTDDTPEPDAASPIELDGLLQERAVASVAQLGDHLTHAVDVDRRAILVVDGGDGAGVPVAVAMAAHLATAGRATLLVDVAGDALASVAPGHHDVHDHPTLAVLVGHPANDPVALVAEAAGDGTMVVVAGAALESPLVTADGDWGGAVVIATTGVADPSSIPHDAFERVMRSRHPLIGIVSIMARPVAAPPGR